MRHPRLARSSRVTGRSRKLHEVPWRFASLRARRAIAAWVLDPDLAVHSDVPPTTCGSDLTNFGELLEATGSSTEVDLDMLLYGAFDLDPFVLEVSPRAVTVCIRDIAVAVVFPFTFEEFWQAVAQLESEVEQRLVSQVDDE